MVIAEEFAVGPAQRQQRSRDIDDVAEERTDLVTVTVGRAINGRYDECQRSLDQLLALLRELGFDVAEKKVKTPRQQLEFLGVHVCGQTCTLRADSERAAQALEELQWYLDQRERLAEGVVESSWRSLLGRLQWRTAGVRGKAVLCCPMTGRP